MPRGTKFKAEQILGKLREAEVELARGKTVPDVVRKLGVTGTTGGAVTVDGILSPGNSPGVFTSASVILGGSSTSLFEINGAASLPTAAGH